MKKIVTYILLSGIISACAGGVQEVANTVKYDEWMFFCVNSMMTNPEITKNNQYVASLAIAEKSCKSQNVSLNKPDHIDLTLVEEDPFVYSVSSNRIISFQSHGLYCIKKLFNLECYNNSGKIIPRKTLDQIRVYAEMEYLISGIESEIVTKANKIKNKNN